MTSDHNAKNETSFRLRLIHALEAKVDPILSSGRPNGQFGTEPWIVRDQDVTLTLAILYKSGLSRFQGDPVLLEAVAAGGRYLRKRQDEKGMYLFNKKDNTEWGMIYMPWTYLRWMVAYDLISEDLAEADRVIWEDGLVLGYSGISELELSSASNIYPGPLPFEAPPKEGEIIPWIHNIPSHHASGLYLAGQRFGRPEWMQQAVTYMHGVVDYQSEYGWWTEHVGPVVLYNRVYLEALALFYNFSRDEEVKGALERGNTFHFNYTYPDCSSIETVDERNPSPPVEEVDDGKGGIVYRPKIMPVHPGMLYSDDGRALLGSILEELESRGTPEVDNAEFLLLCLPDELDDPRLKATPPSRYRMGQESLLVREAPWLVSYSGYCAPRTPNRFIQDRQNLLSIFHRETGLIIGGGNTKLQPRWSTMTVGDIALVSPEGSTRETPLAPESDLAYVPESVSIEETDPRAWTMRISTGGAVMVVGTKILSDQSLVITARLEKAAPDGRKTAAHLTFIRYGESQVQFSDGSTAILGEEAFERSGVASIGYHGWNLTLPEKARVSWPVLPHNPYMGDGRAQIAEGRLVVSLPMDNVGEEVTLTLDV